VAWYLGNLIFEQSVKPLDTSKVLVLLVDLRFVSTPQLDGLVEKLREAGLSIELRKWML
jgi:hypothetical protein